MTKISMKIVKNCKFFIDFLKVFENFSGALGILPLTPNAASPLQACTWRTSLPPEKFLPELKFYILIFPYFFSNILSTMLSYEFLMK